MSVFSRLILISRCAQRNTRGFTGALGLDAGKCYLTEPKCSAANNTPGGHDFSESSLQDSKRSISREPHATTQSARRRFPARLDISWRAGIFRAPPVPELGRGRSHLRRLRELGRGVWHQSGASTL